MIEHNDIAQILHRIGVDFIQKKASDEFAVFEIPMFGVKVIWSLTKYEEKSDDWNVLIVYPYEDMSAVRDNIMWDLARGGFFHYLRTNFPSTFQQMLAGRTGEDWHRKITKKRMEIYGSKPKYAYYRSLNKEGSPMSSSQILSVEPGFYDLMI
jgi:hypothetical protein